MVRSDKKSIFFFISVIFISLYSFYLSSINSIYNQDFHHWSYVLQSFIDYKNNLKLFKEITITHGFGQIILFSLIDNFKKIDLVSIGTISAFFYSINFIIIYKIFTIITSRIISLILVFILFLIHPFIILPWADYYSGLCVNLFIYFFLKCNKGNVTFFFVLSLLLLLSIFFRSTYIISIFLSILTYLILNYKFIKKNHFNVFFYIFFFQIFIFFIFLNYYNNFYLWFSQSILFIKNLLLVSSNPIKEEIISNYSLDIWILLKFIYQLLRTFASLFNVLNANNIIFLIFFLLNIKIIFKIKKIFHKENINNNKIFYISLLGLFGFIQSFHSYEIFRNINATTGIFFAGIYYLKYLKIIKYFKIKIVKLSITFFFPIIVFVLIFNFNKNLSLMESYKINKSNYTTLNNFFFGDKKINKNAANHYNQLHNILCGNNIKIINFTPDYAITYLCNNNQNSQPFYITSRDSKNLMPENLRIVYERIFLQGIIKKNEIVLTIESIDTSIYKDITHISTIHTGHDLNIWHLPRLINIYKLKD